MMWTYVNSIFLKGQKTSEDGSFIEVKEKRVYATGKENILNYVEKLLEKYQTEN